MSLINGWHTLIQTDSLCSSWHLSEWKSVCCWLVVRTGDRQTASVRVDTWVSERVCERVCVVGWWYVQESIQWQYILEINDQLFNLSMMTSLLKHQLTRTQCVEEMTHSLTTMCTVITREYAKVKYFNRYSAFAFNSHFSKHVPQWWIH